MYCACEEHRNMLLSIEKSSLLAKYTSHRACQLSPICNRKLFALHQCVNSGPRLQKTFFTATVKISRARPVSRSEQLFCLQLIIPVLQTDGTVVLSNEPANAISHSLFHLQRPRRISLQSLLATCFHRSIILFCARACFSNKSNLVPRAVRGVVTTNSPGTG